MRSGAPRRAYRPVRPLDGRCFKGLVDLVLRGVFDFDHVFLTRNPHNRRRKAQDFVGEVAATGPIAATVVDENDLPSIDASDAPHEVSVLVQDGDDLRPIGTAHHCRVVAVATFDAHVGVAIGSTKALGFVMTNDQAIALADDGAIAGFLDDDPSPAFLVR